MNLWKDLAQAKKLLEDGQLVAIPTETVYGLAARIDMDTAVRRIFTVKERPFFDPLIIHVNAFSQVDPLIRAWPPLAFYLAAQFWPGPLTLVLPKSQAVSPLITSGLETVAVRMPAHPLARRLVDAVGVPLAAPSANKFGKTSPTTAEHVRREFTGEKIFVLDGGPCVVGLESTVLQISESHAQDEILILRPGAITQEMLEDVTRDWIKPVSLHYQMSEASPGHLQHHYMPNIPLVIVNHQPSLGDLNKIRRQIEMSAGEPLNLHLSENPALAARELYAELRRLSESAGTDPYFILVERKSLQSGAEWTAIWDRLERAATYKLQ